MDPALAQKVPYGRGTPAEVGDEPATDHSKVSVGLIGAGRSRPRHDGLRRRLSAGKDRGDHDLSARPIGIQGFVR